MKRSNTKAAQLKGLIEAATSSGLTVTAIEVEPRRLLIRTEAIAMPTSLTVAKSYADWKAEERRRNG